MCVVAGFSGSQFLLLTLVKSRDRVFELLAEPVDALRGSSRSLLGGLEPFACFVDRQPGALSCLFRRLDSFLCPSTRATLTFDIKVGDRLQFRLSLLPA